MKGYVLNMSDSKLSQLSTGLSLLICKQEMAEPKNVVINRKSFEHDIIQKRHSYSVDLEQVLNELKMTRDFIIGIDRSQQNKNKYVPEEIINYYTGIFLNHVHQIKDKLFQLVYLMIADKPFNKIYKEKKIKVAKFVRDNKDILKIMGIDEHLIEWQEENNTAISVALRKRTRHHHYLSPLTFNMVYQNIK